MAIRGTSVDSDGKEWGVIRRGSKFYYVPMSNLQIKTAPLSVRKSRDKIEESVAGLMNLFIILSVSRTKIKNW